MELKLVLKVVSERLIKLYGDALFKIILYGSHARKEANENSDIDLAVVIKGEIEPGKEIDRMIDIISDINLEYNVLVSIYPVSVEKYTLINSPLLLNMRKEGVSVWAK